ncbi:flagellar hook-basal body complex protein [Ketobacter alkanivorans]|uniref:Flagellar hook protein FlgE n=1 Tax=Ketobacter alkanivorans TaxID=1917421 RepID=A0A2K9LN98_9GAMM|nr:flagellar hook-basal body complex protein [Ketobacter alkanivorans]AUM12955.1 hypothetical protein Kalk_11195 [Ketobacter alkanivorans]
MMGSLYKSLSGLVGFTKALDNLSNNVANLNTPGFKANDVFFRELNSHTSSSNGDVGQGLQDDIGNGVDVHGTSTRFTQGKIQDTGVETDLAIDGRGFFVLLDGNSEFYTRSGQFRFDEDGFLVDPASGLKVAFVGESGRLSALNIDLYESSPAEKSTEVTLAGELNLSDPLDSVFDGGDDELLEVTVFDSDGRGHGLSINFTKIEGSAWEVRVFNEDGAQVSPPHIIEFTGLGNPLESSSSLVFDYYPFSFLEQSELSDGFSSGASLEYSDGISSDVLTSFDLENASLILRSDTEYTLSDLGEYAFDDLGQLVDLESGLVVAARNEVGEISDFSIADKLETPSVETARITVAGNLDGSIEIGGSYPLPDDQPLVFDYVNQNGEEETFFVRFVREASGWVLAANSAGGDVLVTNGVLIFDTDGNLNVSTSALSVETSDTNQSIEFGLVDTNGQPTINSSPGEFTVLQSGHDGKLLGQVSSIEFDEDGVARVFYTNGDEEVGPRLAVVEHNGKMIDSLSIDMSGLSAVSGSASARVDDVDGRSPGQIQNMAFDDFGVLTIDYFNGDTATLDAVAIAQVADASRLKSVGGTLFSLSSRSERVVGRAGSAGGGFLVASSLELSNVELSSEFADIIVVQRGYQASSQVLNVTNEMIEELYNSVRGR